MKPVLEVKGLTRDFGGLRALNELDLTVNEGEIVALIGPNGAGKTTFFNCVTGIYKPTEGTVHLYGANGEKHLLNGRKPHLITALGMARTFQNIRLFSDMTVLENVMIGRHCRTKAGIWGALTRNPATRREEQESIDISYSLLETVHLQELSVIVNTTSSFEEFFIRRNALVIFLHRILRQGIITQVQAAHAQQRRAVLRHQALQRSLPVPRFIRLHAVRLLSHVGRGR